MPKVRASVTQRAREGSVLPSRQLRTTPSENPHILAISVALPTRWISSFMRSEKVPAVVGSVFFCVFIGGGQGDDNGGKRTYRNTESQRNAEDCIKLRSVARVNYRKVQ
jgi:hypothetical protein